MRPEGRGFDTKVRRHEAYQAARSLQALHPPQVGDKVALIGDARPSTLSEIHDDTAVISTPTSGDKEAERGQNRTVPLVNVFRARDLITVAVDVGLPQRDQRHAHLLKNKKF